MEIKFKQNKLIPTNLLLEVIDNKNKYFITYYNLRNCELAYRFDFTSVVSEEKSREIIDKIIEMMIRQSYDHGVRWVVTEKYHGVEDFGYGVKYHWYEINFRVRDAG